MKKLGFCFAVLLALIAAQSARADLVSTYSVATDFDQGGTQLQATLVFDNTTKTVQNLTGTLYDEMGPVLQLNYFLQSSTDASGNIIASTYLLNQLTSYTNSMASGQLNAFSSIAFNPNDVTAVTPSLINEIQFMDCTSGSGMGAQCSTGNAGLAGNTMGTPDAETITFVSSVGSSAVPVPSAVWMFLSGVMGVFSFGRKRIA
jgi:hypothetical protein